MPSGQMSRQRIRYVRASDGVQIAWAESGSGQPVVKAANWLTHLEYDVESPVWSHWIRFFSENFRFVRYDERGCGMTDWKLLNLSVEQWVDDLEMVIDAANVEGPFALLGISHGSAACIGYAVRHPERVSKMILYGGYALGYSHRGDANAVREYQAIVDLFELGWEKENPLFHQLFISRFIPGGSPEQMQWFTDLCRKTTSASIAGELLRIRGQIDVSHLLGEVRTPTLVIHARDDNVVPLAAGRAIAAGIAGSEFVELDSKNHVLLEHEPAWTRFQEVVLDFLGAPNTVMEDAAFASLSPREREVLALITEGLGNAEIGERLSISEKTVRNHISNVYDKLGVWSRAQAMVFARDRGFRG